MGKFKKYTVQLNLTVNAESYAEALEFASDIVDSSKLLDQENVVDAILVEDQDFLDPYEDINYEKTYQEFPEYSNGLLPIYGEGEEFTDLDEF